MIDKYTYKPEIPEVFRCRVPLPGTLQAFVMNGLLRDSLEKEGSFSLIAGSGGGFDFNVERDALIKDNLQIISVRDNKAKEPVSLENNILLRAGSSSSLLLCTHTLDIDDFKTDEIVNIIAEEGARAEIVVMQNENNSSAHSTIFNLDLSENAYLKITIITLHGAEIKNIINSHLNGKGISCQLNGLCLADGEQIMSTAVNMHHHKPENHSSQLFKGILDNNSRSHFTGKIFVDRDAQKTEAYQANHNLLLSRSAKAYVQPQLVIYADDVKCSHGATSGRLDEEGLFYMRSRGIGKEEAKLLQQLAFVNDVLTTISNSHLMARLEELVESRLRGEFGHCTNCSVNCC
jgi:Fe-S cluster assembly protein SufD